MRYVLASVLILAATGAWADDDRATCAEHNGERSISACTRIISSGGLAEGELTAIYALRGVAYRGSSDFGAAIADFTEVIRLVEASRPPDVVASAYVARGNVYALKGDHRLALADFRKALSLSAQDEQARDGIKRAEAALAAIEVPATKPAPPAVKASPPATAAPKPAPQRRTTSVSAPAPRPATPNAAATAAPATEAGPRSVVGHSINWGSDGVATYGRDGSYKYVSHSGHVSAGRYQIRGSQICVTFPNGGQRCDTIRQPAGGGLVLTNQRGRTFMGR